jgi:hypothetical protein
MTALAMIETMKRLWNHVVPLIGRKRIGDLRPKDVEQLAAIPPDARKAGRCGHHALAKIRLRSRENRVAMESPMASGRSRLRVAVRALLKARERTSVVFAGAVRLDR